MTPSDTDNAGRKGGTRTDLRAPVPPAEVPLEVLHGLAMRCLADRHGRDDLDSRLIVRLANGVCALLTKLSSAEQGSEAAARALLFAEARVQFTERGVMELDQQRKELGAKLEGAQASIRLRDPESFEVETAVKPDATLPAEGAP